MFDHVGLNVSDFKKSKVFYEKTLKPLGYKVVSNYEGEACGFGTEGKPRFWLFVGRQPITKGVHVAFSTQNRKTVDGFYKEALAAGGKDNGKPGIREHYHPNYYGAFVYDPDGNNIEAVCHRPE